MRPVVVQPPSGRPRPIVVEVPHAGLHLPAEVRASLLAEPAALARDADLYIDRLYAPAARLGATLVYTELSRFAVDLNRFPDDVDQLSVPDHPRPRADAPRGLIWRVTGDGRSVLGAPLSLAAWRSRVERYHAPYHRALQATLVGARARFGRVLLLSGHSMPSRGRSSTGEPGPRRADVVPGDLEGRACSPRVMQETVAHFDAAGLSVSANDPYKGGATTQRHGRPEDGFHALQLELNRDLFLDEERGEVDERGFARLQHLCLSLVDRLGDLAASL